MIRILRNAVAHRGQAKPLAESGEYIPRTEDIGSNQSKLREIWRMCGHKKTNSFRLQRICSSTKKKKFHRSKVRRASSASCNAGKFPVAFCMIMYAYKQEWLQNNIDCVSSFMGPCTCQNSYRYRMIVFEANWTRSLQVVAACSSLGGDFTLQVRIRSLSAAADNIASSLSQG